jgi:membrane associated rhomboid family serine protease
MILSMVIARLHSHFQEHQEQKFILEALGLVVLLKVLENAFFLWWVTVILFSPALIFCIFRILAVIQDKSTFHVVLENLTFIPAPYLEKDGGKKFFPWVTYCLVLANVLIFYLVAPFLSEQLFGNLVFVPADVTFINTLIAQFSSMFLHANTLHLWGNMAFLWAMGTAVETRIGHGLLFGLYLASGVCGNLLFLVLASLTSDGMPQLIGASGAISGLMGIYAVRCYFKTMVFPFPILGFFSYLLPLSLKIRMNALVVIGLFFWADLHGGMNQLLGTDNSHVAYWCHIGGFLAGVILAYKMNIGQAAIQERRLDTARDAFSGKKWINKDVGEDALREYLTETPNDTQALLLLARNVSRYRLPEEGKDLYQRAIQQLLGSNLDESAEVFKEYFDKYQTPLKPELQIRLAALVERSGNLDLATRALEMLLEKVELTDELVAKCLFHCSRLCKKMGLDEAAEMYATRLKDPL